MKALAKLPEAHVQIRPSPGKTILEEPRWPPLVTMD